MYSMFLDLTQLRMVCLLTHNSLADSGKGSHTSGLFCVVRRLILLSVKEISQGAPQVAVLCP